MKANVLTGIRKLELRDLPDPVLKEDADVLIRVGAVGVCGSDIHYYTTGRIGNQVVQFPFVIGHECSGTVEKVGKKVKKLKPGDRIAVEPAVSCGICDQCREGREHTCRNLLFLGCPGQIPGSLSRYIVLPEKNCYRIGDKISLEVAVLAEPLSIGIYAQKLSQVSPASAIAIFGVGPIGLSVLFACHQQGIRSIFVTDKIESRLQIARNLGAGWTGNPDRQDIVHEITRSHPQGIDVVFECCGEQDAMNQAIHLLKPGGKLMIVGIPTADWINFEIHTLRRKEVCIQNVRRQNRCLSTALELIERHDIFSKNLLTHRFPLNKTCEAFELVEGYHDHVIKAIINVDQIV
jgi:L-iditol 2-dehydrogenase